MSVLETKQLTMRFGGLKAISGLDMEIKEGEMLGLIGPNGAGKSTFINVVNGVYKPSQGSITYKGENISGLRPDQVASRGIVRTFQASTLFMNFSVIQNVLVGFHLNLEIGFFRSLLGGSKTRGQERVLNDKALELLNIFDMDHLRDELTLNLPHGYQRCLGAAMALAGEPELLMLDEPVTGMILEETLNFMRLIKRIQQERKITILLIEHDMKAVMDFCDRIVVLDFGQKIAEGTPQDIQSNKDVIKAYLGERKDVQGNGSES